MKAKQSIILKCFLIVVLLDLFLLLPLLRILTYTFFLITTPKTF